MRFVFREKRQIRLRETFSTLLPVNSKTVHANVRVRNGTAVAVYPASFVWIVKERPLPRYPPRYIPIMNSVLAEYVRTKISSNDVEDNDVFPDLFATERFTLQKWIYS